MINRGNRIYNVSLFIIYDWITMIMDTVSVNLGQKNMLYSLKKIVIGHPYYSHFSKTAAFFCPKEAAVETVGL